MTEHKIAPLEGYKLMSKLVYLDDQYVMRNGKPGDWFLCR